ncbi:MAG: DNA-binding response regulator [Epsilonproteobacteria bacterium]|nr:MAG: DNA-binding response regulator [Campylobacterota bacterium]
MNTIKVLIVEDDEIVANLIQEYLQICHFNVMSVHTITDALSHIKHHDYQLLLLDLTLSDFSGFDLLQNIKNSVALPVIVISAHSDTQSKVKAFKYGASDYMVKPIELEELEARMWALLGRHSDIRTAEEKNIFEIKNNFIFFKQELLELTSLEFELLSLLIKNRHQTMTRETLAKSLSSISSHRSLDHHIKNIRKKIGNDGSNASYLKTEYGVGYRLSF